MTKPLDTIFINDLTVHCIIGVFENERNEKQPVRITVAVSIDTNKASQNDDIHDTLNYHQLANSIVKKVSESSYFLLEKLAQTVADICLEDKRVKQVTVSVKKPKAIKLAESAAIEIIRYNE